MLHCVLMRPLSPCVLSDCNNLYYNTNSGLFYTTCEKSGLNMQITCVAYLTRVLVDNVR